MKKSTVKKQKFEYAVLYRSNGHWYKFGTRSTKEEADKLGVQLVRSMYIAEYYKLEKIKIK